MINAYLRPHLRRLFVLPFVSLLFLTQAFAQDGEALFNNNCRTCHSPFERLTGPALKGVENRYSEEWLLKWIKNAPALIKSGDTEAVKLFNDNKSSGMMQSFTFLKDDEIKAILKYVAEVQPPSAGPTPGGDDEVVEKKSNAWIYLLLAAV